MTSPLPLPSDALELSRLLTPRLNKYIPWEPTPTQAAFLLLDDVPEVMFGGAAGGGKSVAALTAALQYVDVPTYAALMVRKTFPSLFQPGALIPLSHEWLQGTDAHWNGTDRQWRFPSGATLNFGYLDTDLDKFQYQGAAYPFIDFDELTQFPESAYLYLFSRCRRTEAQKARGIPLRMRSQSNPGGVGHEWVKARFITGAAVDRVFIPSKLTDNPHLDVEAYRRSLAQLPLIERLQLEHGNWEAAKAGDWFKREWWQYIDAKDLPAMRRRVRYWDTASTKPSARNKDPDFYSGTLMSEARGRFYIEDRESFREGPAESERRLEAVRDRDGNDVTVYMAQEPGSQSEILIDTYARELFRGYAFHGDRQTGSKLERAKPFSAAVSNGLVFIVRGAWNKEFTDQHEAFPTPGIHDDDVDSASGAHQKLCQGKGSGKGAGYVPPPKGYDSMKGM
jgi:predicted phage terminase large subunit-like protein